MTHPVTYYCPRCETLVDLAREGYLADKTVTPYPLEGWVYAAPTEAFEEADGVRFVCGESGTGDGGDDSVDGNDGNRVTWHGEGCAEPFYLSFVRFEDGVEVEPEPEPETVRLAGPGPTGPRGPDGPPSPGR